MSIVMLIFAILTALSRGATEIALVPNIDPSVRDGAVILEYTGGPDNCGPIGDEACLVVVESDLTIRVLGADIPDTIVN
jgi:hypothetical protein